MNIQKHFAALTACALVLPGLAGATTINIVNHSFEEPGVTDDTIGFPVPGWEAFGNANPAGVFNWQSFAPGTDFANDVPDGSQAAFSNGPSFRQTLGSVGQVGSYSLSVWVGNRPDNSIPDHAINLFAGSELVATASGANTFPGGGINDGIEEWTELSATGSLGAGDAGLGDDLRIELIYTGAPGLLQIGWDNVTLEFEAATAPQVIPLPAAGWLLLGGLAGLAGLGRRRRAGA